MATVLAYVDAVPGRLYPLVPTLLELRRRGHSVALRCGVDELERMRSVGLAAESLAPEIERFEPEDWRARTCFGALRSGLGQFGERARVQVPDLTGSDRGGPTRRPADRRGRLGRRRGGGAIGSPVGVHGVVSPMPLPSRDAPPFGLGLAPRGDLIGRARDRVVRRLALGALERMMASPMNPLRGEIGLPAVRTLNDV